MTSNPRTRRWLAKYGAPGRPAPRPRAAVCVGGPADGQVWPSDAPVRYAPAQDPIRCYFRETDAPPPATISFVTITYRRETFLPHWAAQPVPLFICDLRDRDEWEDEIRVRFFGIPARKRH